MTQSKIVKKMAIDITPYQHRYPCYVEDRYCEIDVVRRRWSEDGDHIYFMLDNHCFVKAKPDEELEVIEHEVLCSQVIQRVLEEDAEKMAHKPPKTKSIRIPLVVDAEGEWASIGWRQWCEKGEKQQGESEILDFLVGSIDGCKSKPHSRMIVTVEVPIPNESSDQTVEVEGEAHVKK